MNKARHSTVRLVGLITFVAALVFVADAATPLGIAGGVPYVIPVVVSLRLPRLRHTVAVAALCTALAILGALLSPPGGPFWIVLTNRAYALMAIWGIAALGLQRNRAWRKLGETLAQVERTVEARTAELAEANAVLQEEVAQRRLALVALRASEERLRRVIASAPVVLWAVDGAGVFTFSEGRSLESLGRSPGELVNRSLFEVYQDFPQVLQNVRRALAGQAFADRVAVGDLVFEVHYAPLTSPDGGVAGAMGVSINVTDRARAEEALQETNKRLEEALAELRETQRQVVQQERLRALGQMASGIAHDFNNTLTPIMGYSELLLRSPRNLENRDLVVEYLERISTAARDAAAVVGRLRQFYQPSTSAGAFLSLDLHRVVAEAISLTRPRWKEQAQAIGKSVAVETDLQPVPLLMGDAGELRQALVNLILNSVDAIQGSGRITVGTQAKEGLAVLTVRDTGIGMPEEVRQRCLEPFFTTKGEAGSGLGLATVYGTVQRHMGSIAIETALGRGTSFSIRLPLGTAGMSPEAVAQREMVQQRPLCILVVEDDPSSREVIAAYLSGEGHTVETAGDGREGMRVFGDGRFDLVVTDLAMPVMSGDALAAAIKSISPGMPVLMLTGFDGEGGEAPVVREMVDQVLAKPISLEELRQAVARLTRPGGQG